MWHKKDNWQGYLFCKRVLYSFRFLLKRKRPLKLGKNRRFSNTCQLFSVLAKHNFLKDSFTTTLYLLDFIGFWPTFGLFHYAKLPSYKRVKCGRLAGPSRTNKKNHYIMTKLNLNQLIIKFSINGFPLPLGIVIIFSTIACFLVTKSALTCGLRELGRSSKKSSKLLFQTLHKLAEPILKRVCKENWTIFHNDLLEALFSRSTNINVTK